MSKDAETTERRGPRLRPGVGALILDAGGQLLVGRRNDSERDHWQLPQGGIRPEESAEDAVLREVLEEIGTSRVTILGVLPRRTRYVWRGPVPAGAEPAVVSRTKDGRRYHGQSHIWFVLRLEGALEEERRSEEFSAFAWIHPDRLLDETHPVRRATYHEVHAMLMRWLARRRPA